MLGIPELTLLRLGYLEVFLRYLKEITKPYVFTDFLRSTSFVEAILIYTINPWALGGVWGLGEGVFCALIFHFFEFLVFGVDL